MLEHSYYFLLGLGGRFEGDAVMVAGSERRLQRRGEECVEREWPDRERNLDMFAALWPCPYKFPREDRRHT